MGNIKIGVETKSGQEQIEVDKITDTCPICHYGIEPRKIYAISENERVQIIFLCPKEKCQRLFISVYKKHEFYHNYPQTDLYDYSGSLPYVKQEHIFPEEVKKISERFCAIYNESEEAEQRSLMNMCGAGYRRALEFLVKDYLIQEIKLDKEKMNNTPLGKCIDDYVGDERIKSCAKRAAWLGNDQTHYYRKWEKKDLADLKTLIELTVNWMQSEYLTKKFAIEMPEDTPKDK